MKKFVKFEFSIYDATGSRCLKDATGKVVVGENGIKYTW